MNRLTLIGNLVKDPERRATKDGVSLVTFIVAENRKRQGVEKSTFFDCTVWGEKLGESVMLFTHKGDTVCVIGEVDTRGYINKAGEVRATLTVNVREVEFLGRRQHYEAPEEAPKLTPVDEDDMPF